MTPHDFDHWLLAPRRRVLVMGVLNVTPDSFSDGRRYQEVDAAAARAREMVAEGADLIDVGGESTRPGAARIDAEEQMRRVLPVIRAIGSLPTVLSIDTTRAEVAAAALDAGAHLLNDVSAGRDDPDMLPLAARRSVPVVLMHMRGEPATMQREATYRDVTAEVRDFLRQRLRAAVETGVDTRRVLLDPGIGFAKTAEHNLELLRRLNALNGLGCPLLLGTSRKAFTARAAGGPAASARLFGTAATVAWAVANGAAVVRVHDVGPMSQVVRMIEAIQSGRIDFSGDPDGPPPAPAL